MCEMGDFQKLQILEARLAGAPVTLFPIVWCLKTTVVTIMTAIGTTDNITKPASMKGVKELQLLKDGA